MLGSKRGVTGEDGRTRRDEEGRGQGERRRTEREDEEDEGRRRRRGRRQTSGYLNIKIVDE